MAGAAVERVLHKLSGVKPSGDGWMARCPAHDDKVQSLQISERDDLSVGLHCHAGCAKDALLDAMGLKFVDLYADKDTSKEIVATFDYKDLTGKLLYQAVRFFPKEFRQRRPDGMGGWDWNMVPLKGQNVVVVVEGEKDADKLWSLGIPATTNIGGASKWGISDTKSLLDAGVTRVIILPDNDDAGLKHAELVAKSAKLANLSVSVVILPDLPDHGDVSDWLNDGHTKEELQALLASKPYVLAPDASPAPVAPPETPTDALVVTDYHLTELGYAEAMRDRYRDMLRYDHQRGHWLIWDGHFWRPDADESAYRLAHDHVRKMQRDAISVPDFTERKRHLDFAMSRERNAPVTSMMAMAKSLLPFALSGDQWDKDGMLLGCPNGVVDLRTGWLRDGKRDDFITLQTGTPYGHAECPRWLQFLDEVFDGKQELIDWIWRAVGYSLTADMREQCFFLAYGAGSNGKSIFIDTLETVFGTYGHRADMRMFAGYAQDTNSFQNADFRGKRLVFAAEVKPNSRMNEHTLKNLTGGESMRAEHKYGDAFTIHPVGKIWLGVNHRPKVADDSHGFWRRVRMVPFLRTFSGSSEDRSLRSKIRAEASGILAWAVQGCLEWQSRGLDAPEIVRAATEDYKATEDVLAEFLDQCLVVNASTSSSIVSVAKVFKAYRDWAVEAGIPERERMTQKAFMFAMEAKFDRAGAGFQGFALVPKDGLPYGD